MTLLRRTLGHIVAGVPGSVRVARPHPSRGLRQFSRDSGRLALCNPSCAR